jgi:hypothetical protein
MSIVLGKPSKANAGNWSITLPLDAPIPVDTSQSIPMEPPPSEKPTQFTHRLLEYRLLSQLPGVSKLVHGEFNPENYLQIQQYAHKMRELVETLPPAFRFENPDTQWDAECPWVMTQREYSCSTTWLSFLVMHRYSMFHIPQSRTGVILSGIKVLEAQERHFRTLSVQHYKLYALAFFTLEAATAIMVVFIAYPAENGDLFATAMLRVKESIARMNTIDAANPFAHPAKELIELLVLRAEKLHDNLASASSSASPSHPRALQGSVSPQYSSSTLTTEIKPPASWQTETFDFSDYTPPPPRSQPLDLTHRDASSSPTNFDLTCGGIIGQYGPIATVVDNVYYTVPDTWDPMIFLERTDSGMTAFTTTGGGDGVGGGYGQDIY